MNYSLDEIKLICLALKEGTHTKIWESKFVTNIKSRIKASKRKKQNEACCYCQRDTTGEFNMVLDIEHILPKSKFENCIFDLDNLAISCKKCNMQEKRERLDFLTVDLLTKYKRNEKSNYFKKENYKFIHPNLDEYFLHMDLVYEQINQTKLRKYYGKTPKGKFTYKYFNLKDLEIKSSNEAQGVRKAINEEIHEKIKEMERKLNKA